MASKVIWQPQAIAQLEKALDQCEYLFGQQVTIDFYDRIAHYDLLLTENPYLGPCEPLLNGLAEGFRSVVVHKHYKLIYHINENSNISIVDMWDTRCEPNKLRQGLRNYL